MLLLLAIVLFVILVRFSQVHSVRWRPGLHVLGYLGAGGVFAGRGAARPARRVAEHN